jgi:hypothetical protein
MARPMTPADLALPEVGPYLGRLADATRRFEDPTVGLDEIRLGLVSDLFERLAAARGFLMTGDQASARTTLDRASWLGLWRTAAGKATERTIAAIRDRLERAAARTNFPRRRLTSLLPTEEDGAVLAAKLDAAGIALEERLARAFGGGESWWDGIRRAAVALEDCWEALEVEVLRELAAVTASVARIERWRPPWWPWLVALGAALAVASWLGLALGGYLPRPSWLDLVNDWFWSLPWP